MTTAFRFVLAAFAALLLILAAAEEVHAYKPRMYDTVVLLLNDGKRLVARDGVKSLALYGIDGTFVRRFALGDEPASVSVSPDDALLLVTTGAGSHFYEVETGEVVWPTAEDREKVERARPARPGRAGASSADGAFTASISPDDRLEITKPDGKLLKHDFASRSRVGRIRPAKNGAFLVTARLHDRNDNEAVSGWEVRPEDGTAREVWKGGNGVSAGTDWLPEPMVGVTGGMGFQTRVTDLRTGKVLCTIDNSANYPRDSPPWGALLTDPCWLSAGCAVVVIVPLALVCFVIQAIQAKRASRP